MLWQSWGIFEANERNNSRAIARAVNDFISKSLMRSGKETP